MSEPLKIYRRPDGDLVENPDPALVAAAERALKALRGYGALIIEFTSPLGGTYHILNPDSRTYP